MVTSCSICICLRWQDFGEGEVGVLANKQGFKDCEQYVLLEAWLADKVHEYCDDKDNLEVVSGWILGIGLCRSTEQTDCMTYK